MLLGMMGLGRKGRNSYDKDDIRRAGITTAKGIDSMEAPASDGVYARYRSRQEHTFGEKLLSARRNKFGGHVEAPAGV